MTIATDETVQRFMHPKGVLSLRTDQDQKILIAISAIPRVKILRLENPVFESPKQIQDSQDSSVSEWTSLEIKKKSP